MKDSIKIRKEQLEAVKESNKVIEESQARTLELNDDIEAQEKVLLDETIKNAQDLNEAIEQLERDRFNNKVDLLREEISLLEEGSNARLEKEKELNDLLIADQKRLSDVKQAEADKDKDRAKENADFIKKQSIALANAVVGGIIKRSEAREKEIDEDISQAKTRQSELRNIADTEVGEAGQRAAESLDELRRLERQKTLEKEKEQAKQARLELLSAGLKAFAANSGQPNAVAKTIADMGVLIAGLTAVSGSFYEGTDSLGKVDKPLDANGGRRIIAHDNEMIIQKSLVEQMGNPSRFDVADIVTRFNDGDLVDKENASQSSQCRSG